MFQSVSHRLAATPCSITLISEDAATRVFTFLLPSYTLEDLKNYSAARFRIDSANTIRFDNLTRGVHDIRDVKCIQSGDVLRVWCVVAAPKAAAAAANAQPPPAKRVKPSSDAKPDAMHIARALRHEVPISRRSALELARGFLDTARAHSAQRAGSAAGAATHAAATAPAAAAAASSSAAAASPSPSKPTRRCVHCRDGTTSTHNWHCPRSDVCVDVVCGTCTHVHRKLCTKTAKWTCDVCKQGFAKRKRGCAEPGCAHPRVCDKNACRNAHRVAEKHTDPAAPSAAAAGNAAAATAPAVINADPGVCCVCMAESATALPSTCNHVCMCMACARLVHKCPICYVAIHAAGVRSTANFKYNC
jgi:hypothetical protein